MLAAENGHTETVREMSGYSGIDINEKDNVSIIDSDKEYSDCMWCCVCYQYMNMSVSDRCERHAEVDQSKIEEDSKKKLELQWVMAVGGGEVYLLVKK